MKKMAVVLALASLVSACVTTRAQTPATRPPLDVPPVPPRAIEPAPPLESPQPEPVADLPAPAPATPPRPTKPRETPSRESQKNEPKPPDTPAAETTPAQNPPPAASAVPPLRTASTADGAQAERQIRDVIGRANTMLTRVDYQKLTPERRKAYDDAKRFIDASEAALKGANYEYARKLADTAETLAKELQGR